MPHAGVGGQLETSIENRKISDHKDQSIGIRLLVRLALDSYPLLEFLMHIHICPSIRVSYYSVVMKI